jgi:hypothetical protein
MFQLKTGKLQTVEEAKKAPLWHGFPWSELKARRLAPPLPPRAASLVDSKDAAGSGESPISTKYLDASTRFDSGGSLLAKLKQDTFHGYSFVSPKA